MDKIKRIEELNRTLEIRQLREKKDTEVLKETLAKISEENEALVKQIDKKNEETYGQSDPGWFFHYEIAGAFLFFSALYALGMTSFVCRIGWEWFLS